MKKTVQFIIEAVVVALLVFGLSLTNLLSPLDYIARDGLYQIPRGINSKIKIIGIDERTLEELGPIQTWSRSTYADLIEILNTDETARPSVIAFDILFSGNVDGGDAVLAKAAEESGNVVTVSNIDYSKRPRWEDEEGTVYYEVEEVYFPYEALRDVTDVGYSNVSPDSDSTVRRIVPSEQTPYGEMNLFSYEVYHKYCELTGTPENERPVDKFGRSLINYSGKPGDFECISMVDVLDGKIDPKAFAGSIVFVGAYAPGMQDSFNVPNGGSNQMYGVEIHANILQSYMQNRFSVSGNPYLFSAIFGIIAGLMHVFFRKRKIWQSVILLFGVIIVDVLVSMFLNNHGITISLIYLPLVSVVSFVYALAFGYLLEQYKRKKVINAFKKYVAPQVVDEIAKKGDFTISLGGENRDIAVLFVDIRGFTTMSEALEPEQVVSILNEYLNLTTISIFNNSGTLDKFVGDATMAVFNSPFDLPDYTYKAVCAAMDIVKGGEALEKDLMEKYGRSVGFGVGVHCGPAVVGNVGCEFRMDFTAIGDTVNTSARLEANAKKGQVLVSQEVVDRLGDRIKVNAIGEIPLKGKSHGFCVYEVTEVVPSQPGDEHPAAEKKEENKAEQTPEQTEEA